MGNWNNAPNRLGNAQANTTATGGVIAPAIVPFDIIKAGNHLTPNPGTGGSIYTIKMSPGQLMLFQLYAKSFRYTCDEDSGVGDIRDQQEWPYINFPDDDGIKDNHAGILGFGLEENILVGDDDDGTEISINFGGSVTLFKGDYWMEAFGEFVDLSDGGGTGALQGSGGQTAELRFLGAVAPIYTVPGGGVFDSDVIIKVETLFDF